MDSSYLSFAREFEHFARGFEYFLPKGIIYSSLALERDLVGVFASLSVSIGIRALKIFR